MTSIPPGVSGGNSGCKTILYPILSDFIFLLFVGPIAVLTLTHFDCFLSARSSARLLLSSS